MRNKPTLKKLQEDNGINLTQQDLNFLESLGFKEQDIIVLSGFGNIDFPLGDDDKDMIETMYNNKVLELVGDVNIPIGAEDKQIIVSMILYEINPNIGEGLNKKSFKKLKYVKKLKNKYKYKTYKKKYRRFRRTNKRR
jgi:hypothetical protein